VSATIEPPPPPIAEDLDAKGRIAPRRRFSEVLAELLDDDNGTRMRLTVGEIAAAMHDRAFGALFFVLGAPNIPAGGIPGFSTLTTIPILFVAVQLVLGRTVLWLPANIAARSFDKRQLAVAIDRVMPWVLRAEKILKPRYPHLSGAVGERVIGLLVIGLCSILILPLPLSNMPPGLAIALFGLGLMERDGVMVIAGVITGVIAVFIFYTIAYGILTVGLLLFRAAFGL
jgi:hypothetical protein